MQPNKSLDQLTPSDNPKPIWGLILNDGSFHIYCHVKGIKIKVEFDNFDQKSLIKILRILKFEPESTEDSTSEMKEFLEEKGIEAHSTEEVKFFYNWFKCFDRDRIYILIKNHLEKIGHILKLDRSKSDWIL